MLAYKENPKKTLFPRDSKAMTMKLECASECVTTHLPICCIVNLHDVQWFPIIIIHHPPKTKNVQRNCVKMG